MSGPADGGLADAGGALNRLAGQSQEAGESLQTSTAGIKDAQSAADGIRSAAEEDTTALRDLKEKAEATDRTLATTGREAAVAATELKEAEVKVGGVRGALGRLRSGVGGVLSMLGGLVGATGPVAKLMGLFGTAMTVGSFAMDAINVAMKTNPLGFVMGLLVPLASYLIDLALNSETGQRIIQEVFAQAGKVFQQIVKFMGPVMKVVGTVVATYFKAYFTVISGTITVIGAVISKGFDLIHSTVTTVSHSLGGIVSGAWNGLKNAVEPVLGWITKDIPAVFTRVKGAVGKTLGGIGGFLTTGMQTVVGVIKGPLDGLIAFANWIVDGLNSLSFSFFGKKFGVHLQKIPMLARGGVAVPGTAHRAGRVLPLAGLGRQRLAGRRTGPSLRIQDHYDSPSAGPRGHAENLLFLAGAHA